MKLLMLIFGLMFLTTTNASASPFVLDCKGHSTTKDFQDFRIVVEQLGKNYKATLSHGFDYQVGANFAVSWYVKFQKDSKNITVETYEHEVNPLKLVVTNNQSAWVDDIQGMKAVINLSHTTYPWMAKPIYINIKSTMACRTEYPMQN